MYGFTLAAGAPAVTTPNGDGNGAVPAWAGEATGVDESLSALAPEARRNGHGDHREVAVDMEQAARKLRHKTLVGLALCSVLPLLMLAYVISWYVLPVLHPQDTMTFLALQLLLLAAMVVMITGGYSMLEHQTNEIAGFVAQLEAARRGLADANAKLQELSFRDPVTDLYNRRFFMIRLEEEISRYRRFGHPVSVALLDVDGFKEVNDKAGHAAGDDTLRGVARLLGENSRGVNVIARHGGDEFAVLLVETDRPGALAYAERIRGLLSAHAFDHGMPITASFGVATVPMDGTLHPEALLCVADEALYSAKRRGKNQVASDMRAPQLLVARPA